MMLHHLYSWPCHHIPIPAFLSQSEVPLKRRVKGLARKLTAADRKKLRGSRLEVGKCQEVLEKFVPGLISGPFRLSTGPKVRLRKGFTLPARHDSNSSLARVENNSIHL